MPIVEQLWTDKNDEVKYGIIRNFANFIRVFPMDIRERLLDNL